MNTLQLTTTFPYKKQDRVLLVGKLKARDERSAKIYANMKHLIFFKEQKRTRNFFSDLQADLSMCVDVHMYSIGEVGKDLDIQALMQMCECAERRRRGRNLSL